MPEDKVIPNTKIYPTEVWVKVIQTYSDETSVESNYKLDPMTFLQYQSRPCRIDRDADGKVLAIEPIEGAATVLLHGHLVK